MSGSLLGCLYHLCRDFYPVPSYLAVRLSDEIPYSHRRCPPRRTRTFMSPLTFLPLIRRGVYGRILIISGLHLFTGRGDSAKPCPDVPRLIIGRNQREEGKGLEPLSHEDSLVFKTNCRPFRATFLVRSFLFILRNSHAFFRGASSLEN